MMILRTTSAPILKPSSCIHQTSSEPELTFRIPRSRPFSLNLSSSSASSDMEEKKMIWITSSENDVRELLKPKKRLSSNGSSLVLIREPKAEEQEEGERSGADQVCDKTSPFQSMWSCSGSSEAPVDKQCGVLLGGGPGNGGCSGGRGDDGGRDGGEDWGQGNESLDGHYQRMIKAHPCDALLLGNYARFLKEVRRNAEKAETYSERAILARRSDEATYGDGDVLSLYGELIWTRHKDAPRAQSYFDQAVQSAPGDCYVLASYARFLWDAGEEEEDDDGGGGGDHDHGQRKNKGLTLVKLAQLLN